MEFIKCMEFIINIITPLVLGAGCITLYLYEVKYIEEEASINKLLTLTLVLATAIVLIYLGIFNINHSTSP